MAPSDHRHCKSCGRVCEPGQETCSTECAEKRRHLLETRRTYTYMMYGLAGVLILLFALGYLHL
jgi:predicted nucleic acid-binding Zn ribbon protein